jgi:transcriptional regulator with XRE-family HTH domain
MVSSLNDKAYIAAITGRRIRTLRQRLRLTLDETAAQAGISKPYLSQVERGHATPSLRALIGIARALGVSLQHFIETPGEAQIVRRAERLTFKGFSGSQTQYGYLTKPDGNLSLEAQLVKIPAGAKHFEVAAQSAEEFMYVLSGEVSLTLEDSTFVLRAGDTAHFESAAPHGWANPTDTESVFVWVGTPKLI